MTNIDERIRQALTAEDKALMESMGEEQTVFSLIGKSFRGKMKTLTVVSWVAMFAMFIFVIYSLTQFVGAADISEKLNRGVAFIVSIQFLGGMKMWYFLELNKLASARDIRRLELRMIENAR